MRFSKTCLPSRLPTLAAGFGTGVFNSKLKTRNSKLDESPFSAHPPFDAQQRQDDGKRPKRAPQPSLTLLDNLGRRMTLQFRRDLIERFVVPVVDGKKLSVAGFGNLFEQIGSRAPVVALAVRKGDGEAGFVSTQRFPGEVRFRFDPVGTFLRWSILARVFSLLAVGCGRYQTGLALRPKDSKLNGCLSRRGEIIFQHAEFDGDFFSWPRSGDRPDLHLLEGGLLRQPADRLADKFEMILRRFSIAHGDEIPTPDVIGHERQGAALAEAADGKQRRAGGRAVAGRRQERLATGAADLIQIGQRRHLCPGLFIGFWVRQQTGNRMNLAGRGQDGAHRSLGLISPFIVALDGKDILQRALSVAAAIERTNTAKHGEPAAVADEILDSLQINRVEVGAMGEVVEKNHVEVLELLQKDVVDGKRNQAQLVVRDVHGIRGRAQKNEGDELDQRVLLHRHAQKAVIPGRRAGKGEDANLVAVDVDLELLVVVFRDLLPWLSGNAEREAVGPELFGVEAEGDFLLEGIRVDGHGTAGDQVLAAIEVERNAFAFEAVNLDREIDLEFAPAKREFRRPHLGDAHIGEAFRLAHAHGKDRNG